MAVIEGLKAFFEGCPLLSERGIGVNYLGTAPSYSLECEAAEPVVRRYVDGSELRQYAFVFASREPYDKDETRAVSAAELYEGLEGWLDEKNAVGELPTLGDGLEAQKIEVTRTAAVRSSKNASARLELKGRLIYKKKGR